MMQAHSDRTNHGQTHEPAPGGSHRASSHSPDAQDGGLFGTVQGVSLIDLLQMYHLARRSVVLHCADRGLVGEIYINRGEIVHAYTAGTTGRTALRRLLGLREGLVTSKPTTGGRARSIDEPMQPLLLDLMREIDEDSMPTRGGHVPSRRLCTDGEADPVAPRCALAAIGAARPLSPEASDHPSSGYPWDNIQIGDPQLRAMARRIPAKAPGGLAHWIGLAALVVSTIGFVLGLLG